MNAPKVIWLIENPELDVDDDHRVIIAHDEDWERIWPGYVLLGVYDKRED